MNRREVLKASGFAIAAASLLRGEAAAAEPARFDYAALKGEARALASKPYAAPAKTVPPPVAHMKWDAFQSIRFREDRALWAGDGLKFRVQFFHLGMQFRKPVRMHEVAGGVAREIAYDPALFDLSKTGLDPATLPRDLGFAGFRVNFAPDFERDVAAFLGASYFRAVGATLQYGLSARGLAVDCGLPRPEEFPDFVAYWFERPAADAATLVVYALLDSPSVAGAYRFEITPGEPLAMRIDAALYPRRAIERLGIAPLTSMFLTAPNDRRIHDDWRPAIHDSDGLAIETGGGEWIWRPLVNPPAVHVSTFADLKPRGFGLMQRERNFEQYQDDGVFYEKRPSVWVEPRGSWGKGAVTLVEIPTRDETMDNVVAFWTPADKPQKGQEYLYGYRMYWTRSNPAGPRLATVQATRTGVGGIVGQKRTHFSWRFVVDFAGGDLPLLGDTARVVPMISASRGKVEIASARPLHSIDGYRAMFDLAPTDNSTEPINLRLYLALDGQAMSETWLYQYTPPPPKQRIF